MRMKVINTRLLFVLVLLAFLISPGGVGGWQAAVAQNLGTLPESEQGSSGKQPAAQTRENEAVSIPTPVEPSGTYGTNDLTYKWTKVAGASQYQYRVWDGSVKKWDKTVSSTACGTTYCAHTPAALDLIDGAYKWTVRAYAGGVWSAWYDLKWFSLKAGFYSPFDNNAEGWQPTYGAWTWAVKDGYYVTDGLYCKWSTARFDQVYSIYTYEVKMRHRGPETYTSFGIYFNGQPWPLASDLKEWNKGYAFYINRDGWFSFYRYDNVNAYIIIPWTETDALIKSSWYNTLKVTYNARSGYTQLFINGTRVFEGVLTDYKWGNVGITAFQNTTSWMQLMVDYASLSVSAPSSSLESEATGGIFIDEATVVPVAGDATGH